VIAVSVDPPAESQRLAQAEDLRFPILADSELALIRALGLVHPGGSPAGGDIAVPAMLLVEAGGRVRWRHRAGAIQERPDPSDLAAEIGKLGG
jgi:peroxiredoxin